MNKEFIQWLEHNKNHYNKERNYYKMWSWAEISMRLSWPRELWK